MRARALIALACACAFPRPAIAADSCAIEAGPASVDAMLAAGLAARVAGRTDASLDCLGRAYLLEPSSGLVHNIGRLFEDLGRYRQAAEAFRRVVADGTADPTLRDADRARLALLEAKLRAAWLRLEFPASVSSQTGPRRYVSGQEREERPGPITLEVLEGDVLVVTPIAGQRYDLTLPAPATARDAWIELPRPPLSLTLDGRELATSLRSVRRIRLTSGAHDIEWIDDQRHIARDAFALAPGQTWMLGASARHSSPLPWIAGGAAVVLGIGGAVFFGMSESDRSSIRDATTDARGVITSLTLARATAIDERSNDRTIVAA